MEAKFTGSLVHGDSCLYVKIFYVDGYLHFTVITGAKQMIKRGF